jgi:hypothetical protein
MIYLKWILLLVCVILALWPLLAGRPDRTHRGGKSS